MGCGSRQMGSGLRSTPGSRGRLRGRASFTMVAQACGLSDVRSTWRTARRATAAPGTSKCSLGCLGSSQDRRPSLYEVRGREMGSPRRRELKQDCPSVIDRARIAPRHAGARLGAARSGSVAGPGRFSAHARVQSEPQPGSPGRHRPRRRGSVETGQLHPPARLGDLTFLEFHKLCSSSHV